jgi:ABC-2 type transport system ATP-binding protein
MTLVIETSGLTRRFANVTAVDGLTISIEAGDVFGFLGHNGAGKTTTVRLLNGVLAATSGSARVFGLDPAIHGPAVRRRTGVLTETPSLDDRLSARATLRIYADIYGVPREQVNRRVDELLDLFDLSARANAKVGEFSKGMRQKMALARTLLHNPEIIFLDEPTAGLDPAATREVHQLIMRVSRSEKRTVFLCTHNLYEAQRLCSHVAVLSQGRLLAAGAPAELAVRYGRRQRMILEVDPQQRTHALDCLTKLQWSPRAEADADNSAVVHVQGTPRGVIPAMIAALVEAGVSIYQVIEEEASLEDVYFALQERASQAGEDGDGAWQ